MKENDLRLLIATRNQGKIKELHALLANLPVVLKSLSDFENIEDVEETGQTFTENAILKAREYALATKMRAVADDSGLEIDALGGAPGVFSARFAGTDADDRTKISKILQKLESNKDKSRAARFICVMAISDETGKIEFLAEGVCEGKIAFKPAGDNGFGYDPVFIPEGFDQTFGELSGEIKQEISHRAHASTKIIRYLRDYIAV